MLRIWRIIFNMRPHIFWFLPIVLTLHCAEGSSFEGGNGGAGASEASTSSGAAGAASSGSGGSQNPCAGISCTTPLPNVCKDSSYLTVMESPGACADGKCAYGEHDEWCAYGCSMGACKGD